MATQGLTSDEQTAVAQFQKDVVEPSMSSLVILDFWAEWCGPCKTLAPVLEKVAADYADKGVILAKVDVDANKFIASQFQVRSIPTVYAIYQGKPVADLTQARTEAQIGGILDQLLEKLQITGGGTAEAPDIAPLLAMGEEVLDSGDGERAVGVFSQILEMVPDSLDAQTGLIRALAALGEVEQAQALLATLPEDQANNPAVERAHSALSLAADKPAEGALGELQAKLASNPDDMDLQLELASATFADGDRDTAADMLLSMVETDREWNDGAAKAKLLSIFEATGLEDPWVAATRRKLSAILFG